MNESSHLLRDYQKKGDEYEDLLVNDNARVASAVGGNQQFSGIKLEEANKSSFQNLSGISKDKVTIPIDWDHIIENFIKNAN